MGVVGVWRARSRITPSVDIGRRTACIPYKASSGEADGVRRRACQRVGRVLGRNLHLLSWRSTDGFLRSATLWALGQGLHSLAFVAVDGHKALAAFALPVLKRPSPPSVPFLSPPAVLPLGLLPIPTGLPLSPKAPPPSSSLISAPSCPQTFQQSTTTPTFPPSRSHPGREGGLVEQTHPRECACFHRPMCTPASPKRMRSATDRAARSSPSQGTNGVVPN